MVLLMKTASVLCVVLASSFALAQKATPDRSGEAKLRDILKANAAIKNLHCVIWDGSREKAEYPYLYDRSIEFWYGGGATFRVETSAHFDNGYRAISDGKVMTVDRLPLPGKGKIIKRLAGKSLIQTPTLRFNNGAASPMFGVLAGEYLLDSVIPKTTFIKEVDGEQGLKGIRFGMENLGCTTLYYLPGDKYMLIRRVEWDSSPEWRKGLEKEGFATPQGKLRKQDIYYMGVNAGIEKMVFDTTIPKGFEVDDQTKAGDPADQNEDPLDQRGKSEEEREREKAGG